MKQKYSIHSFVRVADKLPLNMSHFDSGFDAIVTGTYSQRYGGNDVKSYSLCKIDNGEVVNAISWYQEDQLSLLSDQDIEKASEMVEAYNLR